MREDGKTIRAIVSVLGVHRSSVHRAVKALAEGLAEDNPLMSPVSAQKAGLPSAPDAKESSISSPLVLQNPVNFSPLRRFD